VDPPGDDDVERIVGRIEDQLTTVLGRWRVRRQPDSTNDSDDDL
jgi:hypothetical protein